MAGILFPTMPWHVFFSRFSVARFARATRGLGLGLHIASEIARAHGGAIMVNSADQEIVFTFTMPTASV
ncbi:ATP-binding protein [Rhizobium populisoli]|uniref:ATP-binding protein n=1 Tax=Rhizobium populisoli TaxID=2859785 RepID=UPI0035E43F6B